MVKVGRPAVALGQDQPGAQRRPVGHRLVGRHRGVGRLAGKLLEHVADHGHAGGAADQQHAIQVGPIQPRRLQRLHHGEPRAVQQVLRRLLELLPGDLDARTAAAVLADHGGLAAGGKRPLGVLAFPPQLAGGVGVLARIASVLADELLGHQVHQPLVPVVAAQPHVAVGGQGEELAAADLHHRDVEGAAAQVVDQHPAAAARCCRWRSRKPCWKPKATAAAVGSLMMSITSKPAM